MVAMGRAGNVAVMSVTSSSLIACGADAPLG